MMLAFLFVCNWMRACARVEFWETANARLKTERRQTLDSLQRSKPRYLQNAPKRRLSDFLRTAVSLYLQAVKNAAARFLASLRRIRLQCRTHRVRAQRKTFTIWNTATLACRQTVKPACRQLHVARWPSVDGWPRSEQETSPKQNLVGQARSARSEAEGEAEFSPFPLHPLSPPPKEIK